jgi:hypothetical protein
MQDVVKFEAVNPYRIWKILLCIRNILLHLADH